VKIKKLEKLQAKEILEKSNSLSLVQSNVEFCTQCVKPTGPAKLLRWAEYHFATFNPHLQTKFCGIARQVSLPLRVNMSNTSNNTYLVLWHETRMISIFACLWRRKYLTSLQASVPCMHWNRWPADGLQHALTPRNTWSCCSKCSTDLKPNHKHRDT